MGSHPPHQVSVFLQVYQFINRFTVDQVCTYLLVLVVQDMSGSKTTAFFLCKLLVQYTRKNVSVFFFCVLNGSGYYYGHGI